MGRNIMEFNTIKQYVDIIGTKYSSKYAYKYLKDDEVVGKKYEELRDDIYSLASYFINKGFRKAHIAILGGTSYEWVVSFLASIMSGNVVVPLDKMLPEKELLYLMNAGDVDYLFYSPEFSDTAKKAVEECDKLNEAVDMMSKTFKDIANTETAEIEEVDIDELCEILFTSGTTGTSKGVMLTQRNILANIDDIHKMDFTSNLDTKDDVNVLSVLPIHHTFELTVDNLGILPYGATICINDSLENIVQNLNRFKPHVILVVPAIAEAFYKKIKDATSEPATAKKIKTAKRLNKALGTVGLDMRRTIYKSVLTKLGGNITNIVVGGAALRTEICEFFAEFGVCMIQGYGLTECAPLVAANYPSCNKFGSVGKPVSYMEVKIEDEEILTKGPGLMMGYYKNQAATDEVIVDGWFRTGDLGYLDNEGFLFITGRRKNLIILDNGKNIYPEELEEKLNLIDGVKEAFVYAADGRICTLILPHTPADKDKNKQIEKAIKRVNEELPTYKKITCVNFTAHEFPKTTTLKIKRHELMANIAEQTAKKDVQYVAPNNPTEKRIIDVFEQVLSKKVGILDDFFDLGGDSLTAFEAAALIGISAQELYECSTAESLAAYLSGRNEEDVYEEYVDVNSLILKNANVRYKQPEEPYILLTGATGFLGAHILERLLKNKVKVACLVRNEERLKSTLKRYFPKDYQKFKYKVVRGDIEQPHFGLEDKEYKIMCERITTVIHTAANVHHAGHYEDFERTNVLGTKNIVDFCKDADAILHHTSTASVNGVGTVAIAQGDKVFDEFILDIGQNYVQNVYIHSKYKAEEVVLKARAEGLKANIYRIGNLTWRKKDGVFQKNAQDSGFISRAKGLFKVKMFSAEIAEFPLDFTAVDECADAYVRLALSNRINNIYHLYNPNILTIEKLTSMLFIKSQLVPRAIYEKLLRERIQDKDVAVLSFYSAIASNSRNVPVKCDFTVSSLESLGFKWSKIGIGYLRYLKQYMS